MNSNCPRLIEVALPIREISAESLRDKSLRHGHISTLHLWWARRPLPASRAIVFASIVPDPDDPDCPAEFRQAVIKYLRDEVPAILKGYRRGRIMHTNADPYQPYQGLEDTPRNRLLTFIAKFSSEWLEFEKGKSQKQPSPAEMLDDRCLTKWETSDTGNEQGMMILKIARDLVKIANHGEAPNVIDPFSGGGAIPLEATRLGCQAIANDYNPVAHIILRSTCEFPQKYGVRGFRETENEEFGQITRQNIEAQNILKHDIEQWCHRILIIAKEKIGHLYPPGNDGRSIIGYIWSRTVPCSNPACHTTIPLLKTFALSNKPDKQISLGMVIDSKNILFEVKTGKEIERNEGTIVSNGVRCPVCQQITPTSDIKRSTFEGTSGEQIVAVIVEGTKGKDYREVETSDIEAFKIAEKISQQIEIPHESMPIGPDTVAGRGWNFKKWGDLFNPRQLVIMQTFIDVLNEISPKIYEDTKDDAYAKVIITYITLWISRNSMFLTNMGVWKPSGEFIASPFSLQAIPMVWDYPEINIFNDASGGALSQLDWILRFIDHESVGTQKILPAEVLWGDAARLALPDNHADVGVTDPPYFDAISYAELSDFFYIWLKRGLAEIYPEIFVTPLTPKSEEATALKHRFHGSEELAKKHFTSKLAECLSETKRVIKENGVLAIMFAHQSTEAWTALINAMLEAGLTVTATYPIDTERGARALALDTAALASSITVICRPREIQKAASYRNVRTEIENVVAESVHRFWEYGFRGADLIVACYGPAVGVFAKYEAVERADGKKVSVPELLELVRDAALKSIAGEFKGDNTSRLYFTWATLYGINERAWDDARLVVQISGEGDNAMDVARHQGLFVINGSSCRLALLRDRSDHRHLGEDPTSPLIDQLHQAMRLWKQERRSELVQYLKTNNIAEHEPFWKLAQALFEVLPRGEEDWKLISALLGERETLKQEVRQAEPPKGPEQLSLI